MSVKWTSLFQDLAVPRLGIKNSSGRRTEMCKVLQVCQFCGQVKAVLKDGVRPLDPATERLQTVPRRVKVG